MGTEHRSAVRTGRALSHRATSPVNVHTKYGLRLFTKSLSAWYQENIGFEEQISMCSLCLCFIDKITGNCISSLFKCLVGSTSKNNPA